MGKIHLPSSMSVATGEAANGEGAPRSLKASGPVSDCKYDPKIINLYHLFNRAASMYPDNKCFGARPGGTGDFEWITYNTVSTKVKATAAGISDLGLAPKAPFGMYTTNCMDFQIVALAGFSLNMVCVPVYDTLGDNILQYEMNHAEVPILFIEASKISAVASAVASCPTLKYVVQLTKLDRAAVPAETLAAFEAAGVSLIDLPSLQTAGTAKPLSKLPESAPDDLAFIMYTSGTTGDPKGVCIAQKAIVIGASHCAGLELTPTDVYLSFLPLAHIFETMVEHAILSAGGAVGFFSGNIKKLNDDVLALKPTLFVGVPRVYQRFYEAAYAKIAALGGVKKWLISNLLAAEIANVEKGKKSWRGKFLAKKVGVNIHGGNVRLMISGAAPLPVHVQKFLLAAMGCDVIQGYGMTENCANATLAYMEDYRAGHVGAPMPTSEIKLVDVPEMNYTSASNSSGEVCTRGGCTFVGYHKNKEETDKILMADGWLHTGDIGRWNPDGTLSIIDRKKNIFKLAQGEYVAAEKIEMCVSKSKYVSQPWIYGNSFFPMLVAVVTPDYVELKATAIEKGWCTAETPNTKLAQMDEVKKFILDEMIAEGKAAKLKTFELPQAVYLEGELNDLNQGFSIANDCLTPTFKLKRPQLLKRYQAQINDLYKSLGQDPTKQQ